MTSSDDFRQYDLRTLERKLRSGTISRKDYERFLKGLTDVVDKVVPIGKDAPVDGEKTP